MRIYILQGSSSLIDLLSTNKDLATSKVVIDLVAHVSSAKPSSKLSSSQIERLPSALHLSLLARMPQSNIFHRTSIPTEIRFCRNHWN